MCVYVVCVCVCDMFVCACACLCEVCVCVCMVYVCVYEKFKALYRAHPHQSEPTITGQWLKIRFVCWKP